MCSTVGAIVGFLAQSSLNNGVLNDGVTLEMHKR